MLFDRLFDSSPAPERLACMGCVDRIFVEAVALQERATRVWHDAVPADTTVPALAEAVSPTSVTLFAAVLWEHLCNFRLWHVEDEARRIDVDTTVIAACKRQIDALNQERNNAMERVDACVLSLMQPHLPDDATAKSINTESLGTVIDRLSILSLKLWHMREQLDRTDVDAAHKAACQHKLDTLATQRADLLEAARALLDEYAEGIKRPKVYFQCKMYNDPALNPSLYNAR